MQLDTFLIKSKKFQNINFYLIINNQFFSKKYKKPVIALIKDLEKLILENHKDEYFLINELSENGLYVL